MNLAEAIVLEYRPRDAIKLTSYYVRVNILQVYDKSYNFPISSEYVIFALFRSINGASPIELVTHQSTGHRAPVEFYSSFTLSNISRIYDPLLMSLKYLTVRDLLRVSMTSKFLNRIASEPCLVSELKFHAHRRHAIYFFPPSNLFLFFCSVENCTIKEFASSRLERIRESFTKIWYEEIRYAKDVVFDGVRRPE